MDRELNNHTDPLLADGDATYDHISEANSGKSRDIQADNTEVCYLIISVAAIGTDFARNPKIIVLALVEVTMMTSRHIWRRPANYL